MDHLHEKVLKIETLENRDYNIILSSAYKDLDSDLRKGKYNFSLCAAYI